MATFMDNIKAKASALNKRIVLCEGEDSRVVKAAADTRSSEDRKDNPSRRRGGDQKGESRRRSDGRGYRRSREERKEKGICGAFV